MCAFRCQSKQFLPSIDEISIKCTAMMHMFLRDLRLSAIILLACLFINGCGSTGVGYSRTQSNSQGQISTSMNDYCSANCRQFNSGGQCVEFQEQAAGTCAQFEGNITGAQKELVAYSTFANDVCGRIDQQSQKDRRSIEASINAELSGFLRSLANVNASGAGKLENESTQGVLQEQLAGVIMSEMDCRRSLVEKLIDRSVQ
jgi:hypothetical protein